MFHGHIQTNKLRVHAICAQRRWLSVNDRSKYEEQERSWSVGKKMMAACSQLDMEDDMSDSSYCIDDEVDDEFFYVETSVVVSGTKSYSEVRNRYNFQTGLMIQQEYLRAQRSSTNANSERL